MNIKRAKQEIKDSIEAYLAKDEFGEYLIPAIRQRPILLMGAPGIGKTQIMEQIARECKVGLVSYTITHHTRQSAVGLPFIKEKTFGQETFSVTESFRQGRCASATTACVCTPSPTRKTCRARWLPTPVTRSSPPTEQPCHTHHDDQIQHQITTGAAQNVAYAVGVMVRALIKHAVKPAEEAGGRAMAAFLNGFQHRGAQRRRQD